MMKLLGVLFAFVLVFWQAVGLAWVFLKAAPVFIKGIRIVRNRDRMVAERRAARESERLDRIRHPEKYRPA